MTKDSDNSRTSETRNDKGSVRRRHESTGATDFRRLLELRLSRRDFAVAGIWATAGKSTLLTACATSPEPVKRAFGFEEVPTDASAEDVLPEGYSRQVLISWGDPLNSGGPGFDAAAQTAEHAVQQFGYNNDYLAYLPLGKGDAASAHGLLVVNHEYPLPWLMFRGLDESNAAERMSKEQVDVSLASVGLSVIEVRRENGTWRLVDTSPFNRRVSMFTPIDIRGPARGHARMKTSDDPHGTTVIGTHDNCNGGVTPWGTVLSCEEGSADFFAGDHSKSFDRDHLERYYYNESSETGDYGWARYYPRFNIETEENEANRFEWVVEIDPFEPGRPPVKRTALGRFAHEGAFTVLNQDGRAVVFMGDDWEFEYLYRFVTDGIYDSANREANRDLLDHGTLSVARFSEDGFVQWLPLVFGEGPLTEENGFTDQGDLLIQTRRAADLLGATPMDAPEGFIVNPRSGAVYVALTQNRDRKKDEAWGPNPRPNNEYGHVLELQPPIAGGKRDFAADQFDWTVMVLCGEPQEAAPFHPETRPDSRFTDPDNLAVDALGRLWVCTDDGNGVRDALYVMHTEGEYRNLSRRFYLPPLESECCSPAFTPDNRTLFLSVQHPGELATGIDSLVTNWPHGRRGEPPRPSVIVITRDDGGIVGA